MDAMRFLKIAVPASTTTCDGCPHQLDGFCDLFLDTSFGDAGELERTGGAITGTYKRLPECLAADTTTDYDMNRLLIEVASDDCISVTEDDQPRRDDQDPIPFVAVFNGTRIEVDFDGSGWRIELTKVEP